MHPFSSLFRAQLSSSTTSVMEGLVEVLARVFMSQPHALPQLLDNDPAAVARYLDRWLQIAGALFLEEQIGVKTMAMLGRFRRRIAACSICALLEAGVAVEALVAPSTLPRVAALLHRSSVDDPTFKGDAHELDTMDFKADMGEDFVLARRLEMSKHDAIRGVDAPALYRAALKRLSAACGGDTALAAACGAISRGLGVVVQEMLREG